MLTHSTLFYFPLSNAPVNEETRNEEIRQWTSAIPNHVNRARSATPSLAGSASHSSVRRAQSTTPSLPGSVSHSSPSIITDNIKIINCQTSAKVKSNLVPSIQINDNGGLSDDDEMMGEEREAAFASSLKGKEPVPSNVRKKTLHYMI